MPNLENLKELLNILDEKKSVNYNHFAIHLGNNEGGEASCECNSAEISARLSALENRSDKDTIYNDSELRAQISETQAKIAQLEARIATGGGSGGAKFADLFKIDFPSELNLPMAVRITNGNISYSTEITTLDEAISHYIKYKLDAVGIDYEIATEQNGADISIFVKFKDNSQKIIQTKDMQALPKEKAVKIDDEIHAKFPTNSDKSAFTSYANNQKTGNITFKYDLDGKTLFKHPTYSFINDETIACEFAFPANATNCFYRLCKTTAPECMRVDTNGNSVSIFSEASPYAPLNANGEVLGVIDEWVNFERDLYIDAFMWEYTEPLKIQKVANLQISITQIGEM